jgi:hypothetical protein
VILRGGFDHQLFDRTADGLIESGTMRTSCAKGDLHAVPWRQVHKLDNLADHTLTLVVESPVVQHFSEAFYGDSGEPSAFYDFVGLHPRLVSEMGCL